MPSALTMSQVQVTAMRERDAELSTRARERQKLEDIRQSLTENQWREVIAKARAEGEPRHRIRRLQERAMEARLRG